MSLKDALKKFVRKENRLTPLREKDFDQGMEKIQQKYKNFKESPQVHQGGAFIRHNVVQSKPKPELFVKQVQKIKIKQRKGKVFKALPSGNAFNQTGGQMLI